MKTLIIFLFLILPPFTWGQITDHFAHLDSRWNVAKTFPDGNQQNPNFVATTTTVYGYQGDTLINNDLWFKLYSTDDSLFQNNLVYRGLTRNENNKILYLDTLNQIDTLYDFNLNLGDSMLFNLYGIDPEWLKVIKVDSIQLNGSYYKWFKFAEPVFNAFDKPNEIWIEGIGSIHGPLFPNFPVKFSTEIPDSILLTCTTSDNLQIWHHPSYSKCYINIVLGISAQAEYSLKIYPNPFIDKIFIENISQEHTDLAILNCLGEVVLQRRIATKKETIELSELDDGIYLLVITSSKSKMISKLVKKQ